MSESKPCKWTPDVQGAPLLKEKDSKMCDPYTCTELEASPSGDQGVHSLLGRDTK